MPVYMTFRGPDRLRRFGRNLREQGEKTLRREVYRGINRATKPMRANAKAAARARLPHRGGLAERVARSRLTTRTRLVGRNPSVRIIATSPDNVRRIDRGTVRHPVFGHTDRWVTQPVNPGWFTDPMEAGAVRARREVEQALRDVARQLGQRF